MTVKYRHVLTGALVAACTLLASESTSGHHSHGNYVDTFTDIEGVVTEVHLVNPHSWIYMEVKGPSGQPLRWSLEASSRTALDRVGVQPLKRGDAIKVRCHPLRDGARACLTRRELRQCKLPARGCATGPARD